MTHIKVHMEVDISVEERFVITVEEMLDVISSIIGEMFSDKLIPFNENAVDLISMFLKGQDPEILMWCLATTHKDWEMIKDKNEKYIMEIFPAALKARSLPIDIRVLTSPFTVFHQIQNSKEWKSKNEEQWPVVQEDLDSIWGFIQALVIMVCKKVYKDRVLSSSSKGKREPLDPVYEAIDLAQWKKTFEFEY